MKSLIAVSIALLSFSLMAEARKLNTPSEFDVIPRNSPVKEVVAKFTLKTPAGFEIEQAKYKIKNAMKLFEKDKDYEVIPLVNGPFNKELHLTVSHLPAGFYRLFIKVTDKKTKKEHEYKNKFKDYVMFVIERSIEVPMPDAKENNKTIAGIDSDGDGIRDDIQRWINESSALSTDSKLALKQLATSKQNEILSVHNRNESILATKKSLDSENCLEAFISLEAKINLRKEFEAKLINTKERHYAFIKANSNFNGQSITLSNSDGSESCDFDVK